MKNHHIESHYSFKEVENKIYKMWEENNCFKPIKKRSSSSIKENKKSQPIPFVISIPPPNVTGRLHMGHALNNTIQDILIRYKRMQKFDALWLPGTDHAGIATQTVVKKMLDSQGIDYKEIGRDKFIEYVWEWKNKYGNIILNQLKSLGASCDWSRTSFTMDSKLSTAVNYAFKKLYDDGLIYRGERIVNWCPVDQTALSDDEIETKEGGEKGFLWHIRYPLNHDKTQYLVVATTRPETLFGDRALAVNPEDNRYLQIIGKNAIIPILNQSIPIIADKYVDQEFGTGCLKITPAHDPNDFELGKRHSLTPINVMNADATMNESCPSDYIGLSREQAREKVIQDLKDKKLLEKEESYQVPVGRSYRSKAIIEYRLSKQWFVKMDVLRDKVKEKHKQLNITPSQWNKVYLHWLNHIKDWCISRQIWWGHRIPAWYHKHSDKVLVDTVIPNEVINSPNDWKQEEDVLDTWFSSALWPMSILGWPHKTEDFKHFFPNTTLSTAKDIIFFWVARMNFMSVYFENTIPYSHVFIHPTVMDDKGETMSKSKGNGIDPLHIIKGANTEDLKTPIYDARPSNMTSLIKSIDKKYKNGFEGVGADALRYTLIYLLSTGQELRLSMDNFIDLGRRFTTKLWNSFRFITSYTSTLENSKPITNANKSIKNSTHIEDIWIINALNEAKTSIDNIISNYEFHHMSHTIYNLIWNQFCDWYLEIKKIRFSTNPKDKDSFYYLLLAFIDLLKIIHPIAPFITEEIWRYISLINNQFSLKLPIQEKFIMLETITPNYSLTKKQQREITIFNQIQNIIVQIRSVRSQFNISNKINIKSFFQITQSKNSKLFLSILKKYENIIIKLAGLSKFNLLDNNSSAQKSFILVNGEIEIHLEIREIIDIKLEQQKLNQTLLKLEKDINFLKEKLNKIEFISNAKPQAIQKEKEKLNNLLTKKEKIIYFLKKID